MQHENIRYKTFSRRAAILAGGKALLLSGLVGRLYYLQVVEADQYKTLADENRINLRLLPPPRGRILDRYGAVLARNQQNYRVVLISEQAGRKLHQTLATLGQVIPISDDELRRMLREVKRKRGFVPIMVRENLSWEEVSRIEVNTPDLPGAMIDVGLARRYPFGEVAAHVVGYVAAPSEAELTGDPLLELPDFRIGKNGIEKAYDLALRGKAGNSRVEINAYGRVIEELRRQEGQPGDDIRLTVDMDLQAFATRRLEGESAAAVVLDIHGGEVLALVSTPGYDPNAFTRGLSRKEWRDLLHNPYKPLSNKAIGGQYPPGSTFKMMVALAGLESGIVTPGHRVTCRGVYRIGRYAFYDWKRGGHGELEMEQAIEQSCDVYFYDVARRVGVDRIAEMARRFGLGDSLGIALSGERKGLIPTRGWKRATIGEPWQQGETLITGIGQGYVLATPMQLAVMTARLANGGVAVTPRFVRGGEGGEAPGRVESVGVSAASLAVVTRGMDRVVNSRRGTAYRRRIKEKAFRMAGKTGTSQVRRISKAERDSGVRKNKDKPRAERDHALFVAFAPVDKPRYAVAVVVEHGGGGSAVAAPIARDILLHLQTRERARRQGVAVAPPRPLSEAEG